MPCSSPVLGDLGAPSGGCGCGFLADIILMLRCSSWAPWAADRARGAAWRSDSALYCIHSTSTFKKKENINPKALLSHVCNSNVRLPGADHMPGATLSSLSVLLFDSLDTHKVGTVTVPALGKAVGWGKPRQGVKDPVPRSLSPPADSSVPKVPLGPPATHFCSSSQLPAHPAVTRGWEFPFSVQSVRKE